MRIIQGMHLLTNAKKSSKRACLHSFELKHTPKYYGIGRFSQQTVSKQSKNRKNVLSLLEHTRERLSHHPERQARRSGHPRSDQRSHYGLRHLP